MRCQIDVKGLEAASAAFTKLAIGVSRRVAREAVDKASDPLVEAMIVNAPVDRTSGGNKRPHHGLLANSMGKKVKQYAVEGLSIAICGVERGAPGDRARVVHLIEFGHRIAARKSGTLARTDQRKAGVSRVTGKRAGGSVGGFVPANPFMRRSYMQTKAICRFMLEKYLLDGINHEVARLKTRVK